MTTFLLYDDALRGREMRHEIGEPIMDPIVFVEKDGRRFVCGPPLEEEVLTARDDVIDEFVNYHDLGYDELIRNEAMPPEVIGAELVRRALAKLGADSAVIPANFPVAVADHLRADGIDLVIDSDAWAQRRRKKTPWEIEGIERAQRACDTAMVAAARMLGDAEPTSNGRLRFDGEVLTAEWIRDVMTSELLGQGADCEEIIVQSGDACLRGHDVGSGPIARDQSVIIDCFPHDRRTGVYSDMTRTFVPGTASEDLKALHKHCMRALEMAYDALRPGRSDAFRLVSDYFHSQGFPTQLHFSGEGPLVEGFSHALGHGVGLDVHERPWMGRRSEELQEGDVIAVEPGLYMPGVGGVRLEDTVLVTSDGIVHFTDPYSYDLEP